MQQQRVNENVIVSVSAPVATLTLNRPDKRNALSLQLMRDLTAAFRAAGQDESIRAIVLKAAGKVFSAGHDLSEFPGRDETFYRELFDACVELMTAIQSVPQPVIAQVEGMATAAGCQLVATCDLVVASDAATFATPGVKIGLFCSTPMVALSRVVPRKLAMEMLFTGEPIDARRALEAGLINVIAAPDKIEETVGALIAKITRFSPFVIGLGKRAFYRQVEMAQDDAYAFTKDVMTSNAAADAAREGIAAFLEKRPPRF